MNKIILIGNGFDLAHGLKTRYSDFILWYLKKAYYSLSEKNSYSDKLIVLHRKDFFKAIEINSVYDFKEVIRIQGIRVNYGNTFFKYIIDQCLECNWVDIESSYYSRLLEIFKKTESNLRVDFPKIDTELKSLNRSFENIKEKLIEYLLTVDNTLEKGNEEIFNHFLKEVNETLQKNNKTGNSNKVIYLIFNYTSTIKLYSNALNSGVSKIFYIHGKLNDIKNPIIFGYGDETDEYYEKIERLNKNEFLRNIKSFSYFKNNNYQEFSKFLDKDQYNVHIMGHSCGVSDRILLKSIFEHKNCHQIKIYYYQKSSNENDFFEKTQEISRHFSAINKERMRRIIVPLSDCMPLVKFQQLP